MTIWRFGDDCGTWVYVNEWQSERTFAGVSERQFKWTFGRENRRQILRTACQGDVNDRMTGSYDDGLVG